VLLLLLLCSPAFAQDNPDEDTTAIISGSAITGRIDDNTPRAVYSVDGTRGEVMRFRLQATSGNLDPVLTVFDASGRVLFNRDDYQGSRNVETVLTFDDNTRYFIVVARFGHGLGSTSGEYELLLEQVGVLSEQGTTLQYGTPVINTISNTNPQIFYTFQANAGDILNLEMVRSSGTLDPLLMVVDSGRFLVASNDDANEADRNARVDNLLIEESGTYVVVATRYGESAGDSVGNFVLLVDEAGNSGLGNTRQAPIPLMLNQAVEGQLTAERFQQFYRFEGAQNQLVTVTMERLNREGQLDTLLILTDNEFQPLIENDDGGSGQNSRIERYRIPANGTYFIIATRFGRSAGTSFGAYRLQLQDTGDAFNDVPAEVPRLLYGTVVQDAITADDPDSLFAFWGVEGDSISIVMNRSEGTLDPVLELLDNERLRIVRDDDGGSGINAVLENFSLPYTGVYYIRATRYEGSAKSSESSGRFNLILSEPQAQ